MPEPDPAAAVRRFFRECFPDVSGRTIVAAVSGGADSVCLLHVLYRWREEFGYRLHVAHLNHRLRGAEADTDAAWVEALAVKMGLPATVEARDVESYRRQHRLSLEEAAREVRYAFLGEVAESVSAIAVAVGHTLDDRVETVLMNLVRGTGTRGLRGLMPVSTRRLGPTGETTIIRPILEVTREATSGYCREAGLEPRLDATNLSETPFRNRVRHRLLPLLREYNPRIADSLLRTASIAADDIEYIDAEAARILPEIITEENGALSLDKPKLLALHPALRRYILRAALEKLRGDLKDIELAHIEDMTAALEGPAGRVIGLPDGLWFAVEYQRYVMAEDVAALCPLPKLVGEYRLAVPGVTRLPGWEVSVEDLSGAEASGANRDDECYTARFDAAKLGENLTVRSRLPGDRFHPLGMEEEKKVNRFMMDARIPRSWRARVPLLVAENGPVWIVGWRIDDRVKITGANSAVRRISFRRR